MIGLFSTGIKALKSAPGARMIHSSSATKRNRLSRMRTNFQQKVTERRDAAKKLPLFETLWRELQKRSHPDTLRASNPSEGDNNDATLQVCHLSSSPSASSVSPPCLFLAHSY